jgi:hypothetical protein
MLKLTMQWPWQRTVGLCFLRVFVLFAAANLAASYVIAQEKTVASGNASVAKAVGTIKTIQPDSLVVSAESGVDVTVKLLGTTKILRVPPGEKDLKNAVPLQAQDLQGGDRVLVRGQGSADGHTIAALAVIVMKQADVAATHQHELDDWQKRGAGGLVTGVDPAAATITISSGGISTKKTIVIHIAKTTVLRRYAPGSIKFDDAKPAPLEQIKVGDQLLARGERNPDGGEVTAEEIVSGTFRSIAGTIKAIDVEGNSLTVQDVIAKSSVVVKVSSDSQMWKLPAEMAQGFAMRLKGAAAGGSGNGSGTAQGQAQGQGQTQATAGSQHTSPGSAERSGSESPTARGRGGNGAPDLQRILSRLPSIKLNDLQKGDVVYILATEGGNSDITASKVVAGVEPIFTAAPNRSASSLLAPWSLGASGGEGETSQ